MKKLATVFAEHNTCNTGNTEFQPQHQSGLHLGYNPLLMYGGAGNYIRRCHCAVENLQLYDYSQRLNGARGCSDVELSSLGGPKYLSIPAPSLAPGPFLRRI